MFLLECGIWGLRRLRGRRCTFRFASKVCGGEGELGDGGKGGNEEGDKVEDEGVGGRKWFDEQTVSI